MHYSQEQIQAALGVMSGRIDPKIELRRFDDAQVLHGGTLKSAVEGGLGNPGPLAHRKKAEEIMLALLFEKKAANVVELSSGPSQSIMDACNEARRRMSQATRQEREAAEKRAREIIAGSADEALDASPRTISQLAEWNEAAKQLTRPVEGARCAVGSFHFQCMSYTDGHTGLKLLEWELMTPRWEPLGIVWPVHPEGDWALSVAGAVLEWMRRIDPVHVLHFGTREYSLADAIRSAVAQRTGEVPVPVQPNQ